MIKSKTATIRDLSNLEGQNEVKRPLNLQLFGDGEGSPGEVTPGGEITPEESKTYTEDEYLKGVQSESDRRVTEALKKNDEKWEAKLAENTKKAVSEAERLAKLSADERAKEEFEKEREAFNTERAELNREKLSIQTQKNLKEQGLSEDFAPFLMGETAEITQENIKNFKTVWDSAVTEAVKDRVKGKTPPAGGSDNKIVDPFLEGFNLN
ncbi:MAG: DUF4355 domain-containing protein [Tissierellia bacterium]|nr:DUF4355 domain-containing protein [Tissierellia bacterium]